MTKASIVERLLGEGKIGAEEAVELLKPPGVQLLLFPEQIPYVPMPYTPVSAWVWPFLVTYSSSTAGVNSGSTNCTCSK